MCTLTIYGSVCFHCGVQVYILKRMGGMLESCHTCRLLDLHHVQDMCQDYGLTLPDTLDSLCRNELPKGRKGRLWVLGRNTHTCTLHVHVRMYRL